METQGDPLLTLTGWWHGKRTRLRGLLLQEVFWTVLFSGLEAQALTTIQDCSSFCNGTECDVNLPNDNVVLQALCEATDTVTITAKSVVVDGPNQGRIEAGKSVSINALIPCTSSNTVEINSA